MRITHSLLLISDEVHSHSEFDMLSLLASSSILPQRPKIVAIPPSPGSSLFSQMISRRRPAAHYSSPAILRYALLRDDARRFVTDA
jgi:hypothetical protein